MYCVHFWYILRLDYYIKRLKGCSVYVNNEELAQ